MKEAQRERAARKENASMSEIYIQVIIFTISVNVVVGPLIEHPMCRPHFSFDFFAVIQPHQTCRTSGEPVRRLRFSHHMKVAALKGRRRTSPISSHDIPFLAPLSLDRHPQCRCPVARSVKAIQMLRRRHATILQQSQYHRYFYRTTLHFIRLTAHAISENSELSSRNTMSFEAFFVTSPRQILYHLEDA